ncbi:MAG: PAS domain S-box protein [Pseudomonadota bacterium]
MPDDERLREALLELQLLREREARNHLSTQTVLECVEAISRAPSSRAAIGALFGALKSTLSADACAVLERDEGDDGEGLTVAASSEPAWDRCRTWPPFDALRRPRNIADLRLAGQWRGDVGIEEYTAALVAPSDHAGRGFALMCLRRSGSFSNDALRILQRIAGLAAQSVIGHRNESRLNLLAATIEGSSSGFAISDATRSDNPLIYVNPAFEELSGFAADEVLDRNCRFLTLEPKASRERTRLRHAVETRSGGTFLLRNQRKDGTPFWNELTLYPVRDADDRTTHLVATQRDVSDRIAAEADRDRMRKRMEQAMAVSQDAFLLLDAGRRVLYANTATSQLFPARPHDWATGTTFADNWSGYLDTMRAAEGRVTRLLANPDLTELAELPAGRELSLPDGRTAFVRAADIEDGAMVLWAANITPLKASQILLEQRLAAIEAALDGIAIVDRSGRIAYLNRNAGRALGFEIADMALGRDWTRFYEDAPQAAVQARLFARLSRRGTGATHEVTASPLAEGAVLVIRDVTERLAAETREADLQKALFQVQRRDAVARLASGIAHDFNNLLSAISGSAALIGLDPGDRDKVEEHTARISAAGARAARLVNRLLDVGAPRSQAATFDLRQALSDIPDLVGGTLPDNISFSSRLPDESLLLSGDPDELNQIVVNFILNARDALGAEGGEISLACCVETGDTARRLRVGALVGGEPYARISVRDTGMGVDPEALARIFEPYFTTKGTSGTGLGLPTAAALVRAAGGGIEVETAPGEGSAFHLFWPMAAAERVVSVVSDGPSPRALAGLAVIVVDDEVEVAEVIQGYLERYGAEVAVCTDPELAIEAVREDPGFWSAVVTDYDMPGMSGGDLTEALAREAPDIAVFLVTALARRLSDPRVSPGKIAGMFAKPVDLSQLVSALAAFSSGEPPQADT